MGSKTALWRVTFQHNLKSPKSLNGICPATKLLELLLFPEPLQNTSRWGDLSQTTCKGGNWISDFSALFPFRQQYILGRRLVSCCSATALSQDRFAFSSHPSQSQLLELLQPGLIPPSATGIDLLLESFEHLHILNLYWYLGNLSFIQMFVHSNFTTSTNMHKVLTGMPGIPNVQYSTHGIVFCRVDKEE